MKNVLNFVIRISVLFVIWNLWFVILATLWFVVLGPEDANAATISKPTQSLGLVGYWSFDVGKGTAKAVDMSGRGNHGTLTNMNTTAAWVGGKIGNALDFDGVNDYVDMGDPANGSLDFGSGQSFSISLWFKTSDNASGQSWPGFISKEDADIAPRTGYGCHLDTTAGTLNNFYCETFVSGTADRLESGVANNDNQWHHGVFVRNAAAGRGQLYVDNIIREDSALASTGSVANSVGLVIGLRNANNTDALLFLNGLIDEVRIYNRALSAEEIKRLYRQTSPQMNASQANKLRQGLVGMWTFDGVDMSGNKALDRSGQGNDGTLSSGITRAVGKIGQGLNKRQGSQVNAGSAANLDNLQELSLSMWLYPTAFPTTCGGDWIIMGKVSGSTNYWSPQFRCGYSGRLEFSVNQATTDVLRQTNSDTLKLNQWQNVVVTFASSTAQILASDIHIYVDGVEATYVTSTNGVGARFDDSSGSLFLGGEGASSGDFSGKMDDIRLYNRILTTAEIRQLYKAGSSFHPNVTNKSSIRDGLVGHWSFDGADMGTTSARDASGNANTGWLINGTKKAIGKIGQALNFDGSNDYVSVANSSSLTPSQVTIAAWIYKNDLIFNGDAVVSSTNFDGNPALAAGYELETSVAGSGVVTLFSRDGVLNTNLSTLAVLNAKTWHHVVATVGSDGRKIYVDGLLRASNNDQTSVAASTLPLEIGRRADGGSILFGGLIDEVRVYNRALSADEIKRLYNMGR